MIVNHKHVSVKETMETSSICQDNNCVHCTTKENIFRYSKHHYSSQHDVPKMPYPDPKSPFMDPKSPFMDPKSPFMEGSKQASPFPETDTRHRQAHHGIDKLCMPEKNDLQNQCYRHKVRFSTPFCYSSSLL